MKHDFSLAKKRLGIYINMPDFSWSVQSPSDVPTNEVLVECMKAAYDAFQAKEQELVTKKQLKEQR